MSCQPNEVNGADIQTQTENLLITNQMHYHCAIPAYLRHVGSHAA